MLLLFCFGEHILCLNQSIEIKKWRKSQMKNKLIALLLTTVVAAGTVLIGCSGQNKETASKDAKEITITNVSYDPTREFYAAYDELFQKHWQKEKGQTVKVTASDKDSSPYTSTIVFLVRKGNDKDIHDWNDLIRTGVDVITPNPKTSGGACWNFLAAWAYAREQFDNDEEQIKKFMKKLYQNVLVLDSGARGATSTFVEKGQGDVLIAWENEAYLSMEEYPDDYEIVTPSISILAQPSVAVVDSVAKKRGTEEVAREYLNYLYSDDAQRLAGENYYRPSNEKILKEFSDQFNLDMNLVTIDDFGGWDQAFKDYFDDGAVFDQIYSE